MTSEPFQLADSLPEILAQVWRRLDRAATDMEDPWRFPALATTGTDGPRVRIMALRETDAERRLIYLHTDVRSTKVTELKADPRFCLLFYDPVEMIQVQLSGKIALHRDDAVADRQWERTPLSSRRAYLAPLPPGAPLQTGGVNLPDEFRDRLPTETEIAAGWENFCVLACQVERIEWLKLHRQGNWRAEFWRDRSRWESDWFAP